MAKGLGVTRIRLQKGRYLVKRGDIWYLETCKQGRQFRRSLDTGDIQEATKKALAGDVEQQVLPKPKTAVATALTLQGAFDEFEEWYRKTHKESGCRVTLPAVLKFVNFVGGESHARTVTRDHIQRWLDAKEGRSPIYIRNEYARVRAFLRRTARKHKESIDLDCVNAIDLPKDDGTGKSVPDVETIRAILRKLRAHPWLGDYVTVLLETGMRPGELLAVRGVDLRGKLLDIKPWGSWSPKSKWSVRTIQLTKPAARVLSDRREKLFDKTWPIFGDETGKLRDPNRISMRYRQALKEDGEMPVAWRSVNLYCWRHVFCSLHAQPGPAFMDLQTLAAYIGHAPGSTRTLERWYVDRDALRRGAPPSLVGEAKRGKVISMGR